MKRILSILLVVALLVAFAGCAKENKVKSVTDLDNFYLATYGNYAHTDGYFYFVEETETNDCSGNGTEDANVIYRISDEEGSEPESVITFPSALWWGTPQRTIYYLCPCGDNIYFLAVERDIETGREKNVFYKGSIKDGNYEKTGIDFSRVDGVLCKVVRTENTLYFLNADGWNSPEMKTLDLETGEISSVKTNLPVRSDELYVSVDVENGYVYYLAVDKEEEEIYGLYRVSLEDGSKPEEIAPIEGLDDVMLMLLDCVGDRFFICGEVEYEDEYVYEFFSIDVNTGEKTVYFSPDDYYEFAVTLYDGKIWYMTENGLCSYDLETKETKVETSFHEEGFTSLAIIGNRMYFQIDYETYTMALDGRIFPRKPIIPEYEFEEKSLSDWTYRVYPSFANIIEYKGSNKTVTFPTEIDGLPVYRAGLFPSSEMEEVKEIIFPEGIKTVSWISAKNVKKITIPVSTERIMLEEFGNLDKTFNVADDAEIYYNGTVEQWNRLIKVSAVLADNKMDTVCFKVHCADGVIEAENED